MCACACATCVYVCMCVCLNEKDRKTKQRKEAIRLGYRLPTTDDKQDVDPSKMDLVKIYLKHTQLLKLSGPVSLSMHQGMAQLPADGINLVLEVIQSSFQTAETMELLWSLYSMKRRGFIT